MVFCYILIVYITLHLYWLAPVNLHPSGH